jgi:hypothetical protein
MPGWFDTHAKRSARASGVKAPSVSRRRVLTGGSAAVAGAWAAPMLASAPAYAYGVSGCSNNKICGASNTLQICCTGIVTGPGATHTCAVDSDTGGNVCYANSGNGGFCGNNGNGSCNSGGGRCSGNATNCTCGAGSVAPTYFPHTCGGYGATCTSGAGSATGCAPGYACSGQVCYEVCGGSVSCPSGFACIATGSTSTCRKTCSDDTPCPKMTTCNTSAGYCN